jgi:uncharacterized Rmd1/YagE family protein
LRSSRPTEPSNTFLHQIQDNLLDKKYHDSLGRIGYYNLGPRFSLTDLITDSITAEKYGWVTKKAVGFVLRKSRRKTPENSLDIFEYFSFKTYNKTYTKDTDLLQLVYIFENGSIVFWNFTEEEEEAVNGAILRKLGRVHPLHMDEYFYLDRSVYENDPEMFIKEHVQNNLIYLKSYSNEEKMAYSFALSYSVKLDETEHKLNGIIDSINAESGFDISKILFNFQRQKHFRRLCTLYLIRTEANFDFKILEEDFYSNVSDEFIPQYKQMCIQTKVQNRWVIRKRDCRVAVPHPQGNL